MPLKVDPPKTCEACGKPMFRKRFGRRLEDRTRFLSRRTCGQSCGNARSEVGKSAHHWRARQHRDDRCADCGSRDDLHVHHKDRNHENDDPANLVTLCASCHLKLHWREDRERRLAARRSARPAPPRLRDALGRFLGGAA